MSGRYGSLSAAMHVLGAHSVAVLSIATRSKIWPTNESSLDENTTAQIVHLVAVTQQLVARTDPGSLIDELLVMDASCFHLIQPIAGDDAGPYVAYLLLDRGVANLALARREFRALLDAYRAVPPIPGSQTEAARAAATAPRPAPVRLPRRSVTAAPEPVTETGDDQADDTPWWLNQFAGRQFVNDTHTLQRMLEKLRQSE